MIPALAFASIPTAVYRYAAMAAVLMALCIGCYGYGHHQGVLVSKVAIANFTAQKNAEMAELLGIQTITNTKLVEEVVTKTVHVHDQGVTNASLAINVVPDHQFLSNGWLYLHDAAVSGSDANPTSAADGAPSTTTAAQGLSRVVSNYANCEATAEELKGLQQWIVDTQANIAAANRKAHK